MQQSKFERILDQIAKKEHTSKDRVRKEMQKAIDLAMTSKDPLIQARWASIPKAGDKPTLEEFVEYIATQVYGNT